MATAFDLARGLTKALRESEEGRRMRSLGARVSRDGRLDRLLADFRKAQFAVQAAQLQSRQPAREDVERVQKLARAVEGEPLLQEYLAAENAYGAILVEVQKVLGEAFQPDVPGKVRY